MSDDPKAANYAMTTQVDAVLCEDDRTILYHYYRDEEFRGFESETLPMAVSQDAFLYREFAEARLRALRN